MGKVQLPYKDEFLLDLLNNNYSKETIENYERDLTLLEAFLNSEGIEFEQVDKNIISQFKGFLRQGRHLIILKEYKGLETTNGQGDSRLSSPVAPKTNSGKVGALDSRSINRILSSLRSFLTYLINFDHKVPVPPEAVKLIKTERKISQVAELNELIKLIEAPEEYEKKKKVRFRNRAMLEVLFSTGMRISELTNLNREHINLKGESEEIKDAKIFILGKGKKQRFVYLTPRAKTYLGRYLGIRDDQYPALFIPYRGGRRAKAQEDLYKVRVSTNYLQAKIVEYRKRLGIIAPTSAHSLRHGFATYLAEQGASPAAIQHLLGHESLQTTTRYVHASDKFAEDTHQKYHPLKED
ncbi:tyrosine-type recombinase/integrase [Candidatus Dojkabacteria bacterium]|nr:tyrosine-type recombinase/integrase [Candidatus Dojkabacteria bacterium]